MVIDKIKTFKLKGDAKKFQSTNLLWNQVRFNSPFLWGYISQLATKKDFKERKEWLDYYFKSGEERLEKISKLPKDVQHKLLNFSVDPPKDLTKEQLSLNYNYGRTKKECVEMSEIMYELIKDQIPDISFEEWRSMVSHRTLGETWNGVVARERNTATVLEESIPIKLTKTSGQDDYAYAIDYELMSKDRLIGAVQIKPISYLKSSQMSKAKKANLEKNKKYTQKKNVPVLYVYSEHDGTILNPEIIGEIQQLM